MKMQNTKKIIFISLLAIFTLGFSSCRLLDDAISSTDSAYWDDNDCDKFTVTFSEKTREEKRVTFKFYTLEKYGSCSTTSSSSLKNSTTYKLSRRLKSGESVTITWRDSYNTETLYGKN